MTEWRVSVWSRYHVLAGLYVVGSLSYYRCERLGIERSGILVSSVTTELFQQSSRFFLLLTVTFDALNSGCHSPCL